MNKGIGLLILLLIHAASCPGPEPVTPTGDPGVDLEPAEVCINFERASTEGAINGAPAALLYRDLGITFPSNPVIINNGALCGAPGIIPGPLNNQCLYQGDPDSARPERSCGPLEIRIDPSLNTGYVEFEARNLGFIPIPVEVVATAFGELDGAEVQVDQVRVVSRSELGDLEPFKIIKLESMPSEPFITKVVVDYRTCPPHVVINDLCVNPKQRAIGAVGQTDAGADRLVYYFDYRDRKSYLQLANLASSEVEVHVQIWTVNSEFVECEETNFDDTYTSKDVHTYDLTNLVTNTGNPISLTASMSGEYGFVVVSKSEGPADSLVGSMSIIDDAGYQYKTNAIAPESASTLSNKYGIVNFNSANGYNSSEVIGFTYSVIDSDTVYASGQVSTVLGDHVDQILVLDENEDIISCSPKLFACTDSNTNVGLDNSMRNPKDPDNRVCNSSVISDTNNAGWFRLPIKGPYCTDPVVGDDEGNCSHDTYFVGFIGLNNRSSSGAFDSLWGGENNVEE